MVEINPEEAGKFLDFIYEPDDIFEVRVKRDVDSFATSFFIIPTNRKQFTDLHLSIHDQRNSDVWVGVGPREAVGNKNPKVNRVLWADMNASVTTEEELDASLAASGLPTPSMVVNSGHGFHVYWKLSEALDPSDARKYSKGVHSHLPTDNTHDPTRVMRLPGTINRKDSEDPRLCHILRHDDTLIYDVTEFPRMETTIDNTVRERVFKELSSEDLSRFLAVYVDGQKHSVALPIVGFLRKDRLFNRDEATEAIKKIHTTAGHEWPDANLMKVISDTYSRPISQVVGRSGLFEFGIVPPEEKLFTLELPPARKPTISLIDFSEELEDQEFWVDGIVGPGLTTLWAAAPKSGKSFCAMQLGYHLATGQDLWGLKIPEKKKVLYFQGELSSGMIYSRAIAMFGKKNIPRPEWYAMTDKPDETITLNENPEALMDLAEHYDVIIVDPLSAFNGNDENSYTSVRETLGIFDSLKAKGKAVILVHHTRKMDGGNHVPSANDARGSGLWISSADAIIMQQKVDTSHVRLYFTLRAAPDRDPLTLYRLPNGSFTSNGQEFIQNTHSLGMNLEMLN